jgi:hypothetical protein
MGLGEPLGFTEKHQAQVCILTGRVLKLAVGALDLTKLQAYKTSTLVRTQICYKRSLRFLRSAHDVDKGFI